MMFLGFLLVLAILSIIPILVSAGILVSVSRSGSLFSTTDQLTYGGALIGLVLLSLVLSAVGSILSMFGLELLMLALAPLAVLVTFSLTVEQLLKFIVGEVVFGVVYTLAASAVLWTMISFMGNPIPFW